MGASLVTALSWVLVSGAFGVGTLAQAEPGAVAPARGTLDGGTDSAASEPSGNDAASEGEKEESAVLRLVSWEAPPSCVQLDELREGVERQISADPEVARQVRGELLRGPADWIATLTVFEANSRIGERLLQLEGDNCREHDETLALVIALLLEHGPPPPVEAEGSPLDEPGLPPVEPEPEEPPPPEPEPAEETEPMEPRSVDAPRLLRFRSGAGARLLTGWLPSLSWGPSVFFGARLVDRAALDLQGDFYLPQTTVFDEVTVRASGARLHARACALPKWGRFGFTPCLGLGWLGAFTSGREVAEPQSVVFGTMEAAASVAGGVQIAEDWEIEAGIEGVFPFKRGDFVLESPGGQLPVHRSAAMIFSAHVGVVLTL